jgi:predicted acylesterase/phospholipase RssA
MRAAMLASTRQARLASHATDLRLEPPVGRFGMMEFERIDEIAQVGYDHAKPLVARWLARRARMAG